MGLMSEKVALEVSITELRRMKAEADMILRDLYDSAPAWAGEVESVKESIEIAIRSFSGEPVE